MTLVSLATIAALFASSLPGVRAQDAGAVPMSLSEALTKALENNLDLAVAKKDPEVAWNDLLFQEAAFDPLFQAGLSYGQSKSEAQPAFVLGAAIYVSPSTTSEELFAGISGRLNFGATYEARLTSGKRDSDPAFLNAYNPSYDSALTLLFNLPLLRGFGKEVNEVNVLIAEKNLDISHQELLRQAIDTTRTVEDAYWDLLASIRAHQVAEQALKLAQDLADLNRKKVEVGTLAPIEITQADANVAANVEGVITTKVAVKNAEDNLRRLLAIPPSDPLWAQSINPTEEPMSEPATPNLEEAIATALRTRPELLQARMQIENAELSERVAKKNTRHGLDLSARVIPSGNNLESIQNIQTAGPDGILGTSDDLISQVFNTGGMGTGLGEIVDFNNYDWSIGLTYSVPIGNHAAKANYANARIANEQAHLSGQNTEELVRVDVRRAVRSVESGYERVVAARKNVELQNKKLEAEQKKFDNGMSTSFEVFTFQTDLRNAQLSLIRAMLDYNKALADLERAKGTLLESKGLKLADQNDER
jgi:outer membrane protein TolC